MVGSSINAIFSVCCVARLCCESDIFDIDFVAFRIKLYLWVTSLDPDPFESLAQVRELKVGSCIRTLELFIVVVKVDALVVIQIDHLLLLRLSLSLPLRS